MKVIKTNGMDFAETRALWLDEKRLVAPLETTSEERYIMVARFAESAGSPFILTEMTGCASSLSGVPGTRKGSVMKTISAEEFDRKFYDGEISTII